MSSLLNMITGKGNNADSNSSASSSSSSSMSSGSMSSTNTTAYNPNTHTQGYSHSGYGTSGAGTGTATGVAGVSQHDRQHQYGSNAAMNTTTTGTTTDVGNNDAYITRSEEQLRVGKETFESGRAQLGKHVTTENVSTTVPISKERVVVEREPITSADISSGNLRSDIGEQSYEMRLKEERAVAEKETVPIEKVRLRKEVETAQQEVGADLRKEHIDFNDGYRNTDAYQKGNTTGTNTDMYQKTTTTAAGDMPTTSNTGYGATSGTGYGAGYTGTTTGATTGNTKSSNY